MKKFLIVLISGVTAMWTATAATNSPAVATTNSVTAKDPKAANTKPDPNDPVEKAYQKLMEDDDAAEADADKWIRDNNQFAAQGAGIPDAELKRRIQERFRPIQIAYEQFLKEHPDHARARLAYGSFLGDMGDEDGSLEQWEKALALDPKNPATYNNLANVYGHQGPVKKAFEYYAKAIELNPNEPVYYDNFGTTVFLFRKDAREYFNITEQQVFDKALDLYSKALKLDPTNFTMASDVAQTYYGIKPMRLEDALKAWTNTLALAHDEIEREGVYVHFARLKLVGGRLVEARGHINAVTNEMYADLKKRISRNIDEAEKKGTDTNAPPAALPVTNAPIAAPPK